MSVNEIDGLAYGVGTAESSHADNIDGLSSPDPTVAATARLNRELINLIDKWTDAEASRGTDTASMVLASMHGVNSVCGTILLRLPRHERAKMHRQIRKVLLESYDAVGRAVQQVP
ncbi:MAG: hypothetical protein AAFR55_01515 [Pseudomonadota bacterium]